MEGRRGKEGREGECSKEDENSTILVAVSLQLLPIQTLSLLTC